MAPTHGRLEGRVTVPTGGWTLSINDSGAGGAVTATLPAGKYYWNSADGDGGGSSSLLTAISDALNLAATTDTITVTLSADESGTGRVTITSSGATVITWVSTDWRDVMGFTVNLTSNTTWTGPSQARSIWLPSCAYNAPNGIDATFRGWREADYRSVENAAGYAWAHMGQEKVVTWLRWASIARSKVWQANETLANESWERFARDAIWGEAGWGTPGGPLRFYPSAASSTVFGTYMAMDYTQLNPQPYFDGFAGGPWRIELERLVAVPGALDEGVG